MAQSADPRKIGLALAGRVAAYRFDARLPSENEAMRRLIELGLEAAKK